MKKEIDMNGKIENVGIYIVISFNLTEQPRFLLLQI